MTSDPNPPQPLVDQVGELILANDRLGADWTSLAMVLIVQPDEYRVSVQQSIFAQELAR